MHGIDIALIFRFIYIILSFGLGLGLILCCFRNQDQFL